MERWINQILTKDLVVMVLHSLFQEFLQTEFFFSFYTDIFLLYTPILLRILSFSFSFSFLFSFLPFHLDTPLLSMTLRKRDMPKPLTLYPLPFLSRFRVFLFRFFSLKWIPLPSDQKSLMKTDTFDSILLYHTRRQLQSKTITPNTIT